MDYLIFIPNVQGSSEKPLHDVGLGSLVRGGEPLPSTVQVDRGPEGKFGTIYGWITGTDSDHTLGMFPSTKWLKNWDGKFWIGINESSPPQPVDVIRKQIIPGKKITLADGFSWMVPTISQLPHKFFQDENGEVARKIREEYQEHYEVAMQINSELMESFSKIEELRTVDDKLADSQFIPVTISNGLKFIASALSINYRLTFEICMLLGMFDNKSAAMAMVVFCELSEIRMVSDTLKKKELQHVFIHAGSLT